MECHIRFKETKKETICLFLKQKKDVSPIPSSILRLLKGQNSINNVGEVNALCIFSYDALYL